MFLFLVFLVFLVFLAFPLSGHHSTADYDLKHPASIAGVVTNFEWSNPHAYIYVDVMGADGALDHWVIEVASPNMLERVGWSKDSLKPGDKVLCSGARAKDGSPRMRPDGRQLDRSVLFPISKATIHDNWHTLGLRGTASYTYEVTDLFVPEEETVDREEPKELVERGTDGQAGDAEVRAELPLGGNRGTYAEPFDQLEHLLPRGALLRHLALGPYHFHPGGDYRGIGQSGQCHCVSVSNAV